MESRACLGCAKARRKCDRQTPSCLRCQGRSIICDYPASKPSSFVAIVDGVAQHAALPLLDFESSFPATSRFSCFGTPAESWWFESPKSWVIAQAPTPLISHTQRFAASDLDYVLNVLFQWLVEWVKNGSCPFIHGQLYRHRLPECIQDAYVSLSSYLQKTANNEHLICRIVEKKATELVARGVPSAELNATTVPGSLDTLEYLARVQALLVYQFIGLYDGNIRLRRLAEQHIPVLESWLYQLHDHTSQTSGCGDTLISAPSEQPTYDISIAGPASHENLLWYSWVVIESSRRTWLITAGIQGVYKLLQQQTASCMGGITFTGRRGFWEAPTASAWEKQCVEVYAGLVHLTEVEKLLAMVPRNEINEFAKLVLECTYGVKQTALWGL